MECFQMALMMVETWKSNPTCMNIAVVMSDTESNLLNLMA